MGEAVITKQEIKESDNPRGLYGERGIPVGDPRFIWTMEEVGDEYHYKWWPKDNHESSL
jgi:hypothetical protein